MPISRRKARRLAREERKKNNIEGGGDSGESHMSEFIYRAVRNSMLAQQFMNMIPFLSAAVLFYGLYHTFEQGSRSG